MKIFIFKGHSDDTFGEYNATGVDYDNCASMTPIGFKLDSSEGSLLVIGQYSRNDTGCWDIGISQVDEDTSIPEWKMNFSSEGYSVVLTIEVPDDTTIQHFEPSEGKF